MFLSLSLNKSSGKDYKQTKQKIQTENLKNIDYKSMQSELLCPSFLGNEQASFKTCVVVSLWDDPGDHLLMPMSCVTLPYVRAARPGIHAKWMECAKGMDATFEVRWQEAETSVLDSLWHCLWKGKLSCHEDLQAACQVWGPRGEGLSFQQLYGEFWREQWAFRSDLRLAHSWAAASEETLNQRHPGPDPQKYRVK